MSAAEHALEERVRATLHRRAADIEVDPPPWEELVGRASGVVVPLRPTTTVDPPAHLRPLQRHRLPRVSLRPALATAAALLLALGAAAVVGDRDGTGTGGDTPADDGDGDTTVALDVPDTPVVPSPGSSDFVPQAATALPVDTSSVQEVDPTADPRTLVEVYLQEVGLAGSATEDDGFELQVDPLKTEPEDLVDPLEGTVWWSVWDRSGTRLTIGTVFVRVTDPGAAYRTWEVVGAFTSAQSPVGSMNLGGVRRAGGVLAFDVGAYFSDPTARVLVNGVEAHDGRLRDGFEQFVVEDPAPDQPVVVQLQHLEDGTPVAVTAMAVAPGQDRFVVESRGAAVSTEIPFPPSSTAPPGSTAGP